MTGPALGERAYLAYRDAVGGMNWQGQSMPLWADLPEPIRRAWTAAATDIWQAAFQDIEDAGLRLTARKPAP